MRGGNDLKVMAFFAEMSDLGSKQLIFKSVDGYFTTKKSEWIRVLELGENCPWIKKMSYHLNYNGIGRNHYPPSRIYLGNRVHVLKRCRRESLSISPFCENTPGEGFWDYANLHKHFR